MANSDSNWKSTYGKCRMGQEQNIKLGREEFVAMEALSHDSGSNILAMTPRPGLNTLLISLLETVEITTIQKNEVEML